GGLSVEEHVRRRLASVQHNRAEWFVGCVDGEVVTSLGAYPLQFRCRGRIVPGIAIGAVHTRADCRGRGHAPLLIRDVERQVRAASGAAIGLLYSDIDPGYYARLGYVECPAWTADFDPRDAAFDAAENAAGEITRLSPGDAAGQMSELYRASYADRPVSIHRDEDYWRFLCLKSPDDDIYVLGPLDEILGYVRLRLDKGSLRIRDAAARGADFGPLMNAVVSVARRRGADRVTGWLPKPPPELQHFTVRRRTDEITMLKSLSDDVAIDAAVVTAAEDFREIDHV
ncbi:MAG: GNAT family N-acetyltransferase, partial [Planctomycetaceae bacterium]